jgi:uncharacterized protein (TIGR02646 family)
MRRVYRGELDLRTRLALRKQQATCCDSNAARARWNTFRQSTQARPVVGELSRMAGHRARCFYCSDSMASDVEHFLPITPDFHQAFAWANLLWICAPCNRKKSAIYPMKGGIRVLIDPTRDDPWKHVTLASATGVLAPRFSVEGVADRRGEETLAILDILNHESVAEGRRRSIRRLQEAVAEHVETGNTVVQLCKLARAVAEDDYGVARWFAFWEGRHERPFSDLALTQPPWRRFVRSVACQAS